jgi:DNA polymerase-3 subunit beta
VITGKGVIPAAPFAAAAKWATRFVPTKPSVPVQGGLMLDFHDGRLSIVGRGENVAGRSVVDIDGDLDGQVVVSARLLSTVAGLLPDKAVRIGQESGAAITIHAGSWRGTLPAMAAGNFPSPPPAPTPIGTVRGDDLADAIKRVSVARSHDDKAHIHRRLSHLSAEGSTVTVTANGGYRVARMIIPFEAAGGGEGLLYTQEAAGVGASMAGPDTVTIGLSDSAIGFATPTRVVIVQQVIGGHLAPFPIEAIRTGLATGLPECATVNLANLRGELQRAEAMLEAEQPIWLGFTAGVITCHAIGVQLEQGSDGTVAADYAGPDHRLAFNVQYLNDALKEAPGDRVDISFTTKKLAGVLLSSPDHDEWRHLLAPLKK